MPYAGRLFDLQVNGYLGTSFSDSDLTEEGCQHAFSQYLKNGATQFLPTVITAPEEHYQQVFPILARVRQDSEFMHLIPGFHLEGPFISNQPGAVGAHNPEWTQAPHIDTFNRIQDWAKGMIKLVTIASDLDGAPELCKALTKAGISVSLGHQLASYDDLSRLADSGAKSITHLGNGMPNRVDRHDNPLINGLIHPALTPMIIPDGHHLPPHLVEGIIRLRGKDDVIFVSDASPLAGLPAGEYHTLGNDCVIDEDGKLYNPHTDFLVGSSFSMRRCANFMADDLKINDADIERMGYHNAMELI